MSGPTLFSKVFPRCFRSSVSETLPNNRDPRIPALPGSGVSTAPSIAAPISTVSTFNSQSNQLPGLPTVEANGSFPVQQQTPDMPWTGTQCPPSSKVVTPELLQSPAGVSSTVSKPKQRSKPNPSSQLDVETSTVTLLTPDDFMGGNDTSALPQNDGFKEPSQDPVSEATDAPRIPLLIPSDFTNCEAEARASDGQKTEDLPQPKREPSQFVSPAEEILHIRKQLQDFKELKAKYK